MKKKNQLSKKAAAKEAAKARNATSKKTEAARTAPNPEKRLFTVMIAVLCLCAILCGTACGIFVWRKANFARYYSAYDKLNLKKYMDLSQKDYTGQNITLEACEYYDEDSIEDVLLSTRLSNRTLAAEGVRDRVIGLGDDVYYFILGVFDGDTPILTDYFAGNDYASYSAATVGTNRMVSDDFDDELIKAAVRPADTAREIVMYGTLTGTETVALSYTATAGTVEDDGEGGEKITWNTKTAKQLSSARVELPALDEKLRSAIVSGCEAIRDAFTVELRDYDVDGDGTAEQIVKFDVTVNFIVTEETYVSIPFTFRTGYFSSADDATLKQYENKPLTAHLLVLSMDDYTVPEWNAAFIKDTLGFKTDLTDDGKIFAAYKADLLASTNEEIKASYGQYKRKQAIGVVAEALYKAGAYSDPPLSLTNAAADEGLDHLLNEYAAAYGTAAPSEEALNNYVTSVYYSQYGFQTYSQYCDWYAQSVVYQEMLLFYIFRDQGMKITKDDLDAAYREYVDGLIANAGNAEEYDEAYFVKTRGKTDLYVSARHDLIYKMVGDFLLENNTCKTEG